MFTKIKKLPPDSIFSVVESFKADSNPNKINASIGVYADEEGRPYVFDSIQKAGLELETRNFNYLPISGSKEFLNHAARLFWGEGANISNIASQQTCGGTHACSLFFDLVAKDTGVSDILLGVPTWDNYFQIFDKHKIKTHPHLNSGGSVDFEAYKKAIENADVGSVLLLQGGNTHNPVGKNLSIVEIKKLLPLVKEKNIYIFVDYAYFGFGAGFEKDREFIKFFNDNVPEFALAVSFSKNASLYRHRTGALFIKTKDDHHKEIVESHMQSLIRKTISNLPTYGAEIMNGVFKNYFGEWSNEVDRVRESIHKRRDLLVDALPERFLHLRDCEGMFGITNLSEKEVELLRKNHSLYLLDNGRINFAGIKLAEIKTIASAISAVT